ncbi:MAG: hypothetical protein K8T25_13935 [Planctomycetia bacterium]|nr:hypothetical protein [Planctomycetia bacterium]
MPETPDADDDAPSSAGVPLSVYVPNLDPGFQLSAGFLYLRPGADNLGYATITTFLPIQNPQWAVQALDPENQPGFSVGARRILPCSGQDIQANWEHLRSSDSASVAVSDLDTQWISPFNQTGPSTSETANEVGIFHFKAAQAQVDFDYDMVNLDVGQTLSIGSNTQVRLFAGLSFVRLREQLISTFFNDPNIDPVPPVVAPANPGLKYISLNNTSTYTGVGPRLGFSTQYNLSHGFTLMGQLSGAILEGWMQPAQYAFSGVYDDRVDSERISSDSVMQVVYASDAKLGLGYTRPLGKVHVLSLEAGFKAAVYVNPFSTYETSTNVLPLDIGSLSTNSMRHTPSDFTLSGLYATCGLQW